MTVEQRAAEMAAQFSIDTVALQRADEANAKAAEALARATEAERVMTLQYQHLAEKVAETSVGLKQNNAEMREGFKTLERALVATTDRYRETLDAKFEEHEKAEMEHINEARRKSDTWLRWALTIAAGAAMSMLGYIVKMKLGV